MHDIWQSLKSWIPIPTLSESRMREIRPSGSMRGTWKRGMAELLRDRQPKGPGTDMLDLRYRATSLLCSRGGGQEG